MNEEQIAVLQWSNRQAQNDVRFTAVQLQTVLRDLARQLLHVADELRDHGAIASVNALGEVQGRGSEVDRLCALLVEKRRAAFALANLTRDLGVQS